MFGRGFAARSTACMLLLPPAVRVPQDLWVAVMPLNFRLHIERGDVCTMLTATLYAMIVLGAPTVAYAMGYVMQNPRCSVHLRFLVPVGYIFVMATIALCVDRRAVLCVHCEAEFQNRTWVRKCVV